MSYLLSERKVQITASEDGFSSKLSVTMVYLKELGWSPHKLSKELDTAKLLNLLNLCTSSKTEEGISYLLSERNVTYYSQQRWV